MIWLAACDASVPAGGARLELVEEAAGGWAVEVAGVDPATLDRLETLRPAGLAETLRVYTVADATAAGEIDGHPPVLGQVTVEGARVRWRPRFPLVAGREYLARWHPPGEDVPSLEAVLTPAAVATFDAPQVTAIHPAAEVVPANLLRAYVHFSVPMVPGRALEHVRVIADGEPLEGALVVPETELWSPAADRLTLLFDPGRIKQGVGPNVEIGAPLREGMVVELRIESGWPAQEGGELGASASRRWRVGPADRDRPRAGAWTVVPPSGPDAPLRIELPEPLDHALLERLVRVETAAAEPVAGTVSVGGGGRDWSFRPAQPWRPGAYAVRVGPELEDLAGNSLERLFDEPLRHDRVGERELPDLWLPFRVGDP